MFPMRELDQFKNNWAAQSGSHLDKVFNLKDRSEELSLYECKRKYSDPRRASNSSKVNFNGRHMPLQMHLILCAMSISQ